MAAIRRVPGKEAKEFLPTGSKPGQEDAVSLMTACEVGGGLTEAGGLCP